MQTYAYLRVSTANQDINKNRMEILEFANDRKLVPVEWVEESISGKIPWKQRKIGELVSNLKCNDTLIVNELSRLGRSMLECMEILAILSEKSVKVYSVKGNWRLDNSIQSKIVAMIFSMAAEIERELISERTKEALRIKKMQGIKLGRPKNSGKSKLDKYKIEIESMLQNGVKQSFIAKKYGVTEATVSRWKKKNIG